MCGARIWAPGLLTGQHARRTQAIKARCLVGCFFFPPFPTFVYATLAIIDAGRVWPTYELGTTGTAQ